jgi:hypothetical protein
MVRAALLALALALFGGSLLALFSADGDAGGINDPDG